MREQGLWRYGESRSERLEAARSFRRPQGALRVRPEQLLAFESRWPGHTTGKDEGIRGELGITPARYYQLLVRAADSFEGIAAEPLTARRVRETGAARAAARVRRTGLAA